MINLEALKLQERTINEVIKQLSYKDEVTLKAPTGSGKTVMIAQIMNRLLETNANLVFIVTTLAKSELGVQNHETFVN
jgi:type III restriction enzyme